MKLRSQLEILLFIVFLPVSFFSQNKTESEILPPGFLNKAFSHIEYLAGLGHRQVASENEVKAINFIGNQFKKMGINYEIQPFIFQSYEINKWELEINGRKIKITGLGVNPYKERNFEQLEGVPVFVDINKPGKVGASVETAGKTIIAKDWNAHFQMLGLMPERIIYISAVDFDALTEKPSHYYKLNIKGGMKNFKSANVVASIGNNKSKEIIISAHFDTYRKNPGASDNGSGVALLLELARFFKLREKELNCVIKFVLFGGEEAGLLGSRHYLKDNAESLAKCELLFNIDDIGGNKNILVELKGNMPVPENLKCKTQIPPYLNEVPWEGINSMWRMIPDPDLLKIFGAGIHPEWLVKVVEKSVKETGVEVSYSSTHGSDQIVFAQGGIVTSGISNTTEFQHTPKDTPGNVNKKSLKMAGELTVRIISNSLKELGGRK